MREAVTRFAHYLPHEDNRKVFAILIFRFHYLKRVVKSLATTFADERVCWQDFRFFNPKIVILTTTKLISERSEPRCALAAENPKE